MGPQPTSQKKGPVAAAECGCAADQPTGWLASADPMAPRLGYPRAADAPDPQGGATMARLEIGAKAPAFTLEDQDGTKVSLASFKGRKVVVYFYPKDDTPGCTKEACQFNENLAAFDSLGVDVVGISPDGAAAHTKFIGKYGLHFSLLSDPDKKVMEAYGAFGEKTMYGKKTMGVIRSTFLIDEKGKVQACWYNVRADGHAAKVLDALG